MTDLQAGGLATPTSAKPDRAGASRRSIAVGDHLAERLVDVIVHPDDIDDVLRRARLILMARFVFPENAPAVKASGSRRRGAERKPGRGRRMRRIEPLVRRLAEAFLAASPGEMLTHEALRDAVSLKGGDVSTTKLVHVAVCKLRRLLADAGLDSEAVRNIHGCGYALAPDHRESVASLTRSVWP